MADKVQVLGLSLSDKGVQAAEIEQEGSSNTLLAIDEWENTLPEKAGRNGHGIDQFLEYLSAFMKVNRVQARRVSVALDTSQVFINTIPMEAGISRPEMNEQIEWELSQYFPDVPSKAFITDVHPLTHHTTERWSEMLTVSVNRRDAYAIQQALVKLGLSLHVVDVDHFSADTALRFNYPDTNQKFLALVGIKENRLDISLIKNGNMESYSYSAVQSNAEIVEQVSRLSRETRGIFSITVYGPFLDNDLLVQIRRNSSLLVEALNPLRHVRVSDTLRLADQISAPTYRFASAVGVALRRD
jgi:Tfp pilus assembly PilM family ATPase